MAQPAGERCAGVYDTRVMEAAPVAWVVYAGGSRLGACDRRSQPYLRKGTRGDVRVRRTLGVHPRRERARCSLVGAVLQASSRVCTPLPAREILRRAWGGDGCCGWMGVVVACAAHEVVCVCAFPPLGSRPYGAIDGENPPASWVSMKSAQQAEAV